MSGMFTPCTHVKAVGGGFREFSPENFENLECRRSHLRPFYNVTKLLNWHHFSILLNDLEKETAIMLRFKWFFIIAQNRISFSLTDRQENTSTYPAISML